MRKPNYVVEEHKKKATLVWAGLLLSLVGVVIWKIVTLVNQYHNPSTTFTVSDDLYRFPYLEVCFLDGDGCDENIGRCIASAGSTTFNPCGEVEKVMIESAEESSNCLTFDLEQVEIEELVKTCPYASPRPTMEIRVFWEPTNNSVAEGQYNSRVAVFLGGADILQHTWVPYTRVLLSEEEGQSEVEARLTDMLFFGSTSSSSQPFDNENGSIGALYLTLTLGKFSLTTLSEDNPINIPDFIASIGGFWEVLLLAWGFFFIATHDTTPKQKARSFEQPIERSKSVMGISRTSAPRAVATVAEDGGEEQPNWSVAHGGPIQVNGGTNGDRVSVNESTV